MKKKLDRAFNYFKGTFESNYVITTHELPTCIFYIKLSFW